MLKQSEACFGLLWITVCIGSGCYDNYSLRMRGDLSRGGKTSPSRKLELLDQNDI